MLTLALDGRRSLRLLEDADAEELQALIDRDREYLARWLPWAGGQTLEHTREFIQRSDRELSDRKTLQTAIIDGGRIIGVIGLGSVDWANRSSAIGYWIAQDAQGHGTVTRAARALVDHAFGPWELNRVWIGAGVGNVRSRAIPERLGFVQEGVLRQAERVGERWIDVVVYSMLAEDWAGAAA